MQGYGPFSESAEGEKHCRVGNSRRRRDAKQIWDYNTDRKEDHNICTKPNIGKCKKENQRGLPELLSPAPKVVDTEPTLIWNKHKYSFATTMTQNIFTFIFGHLFECHRFVFTQVL